MLFGFGQAVSGSPENDRYIALFNQFRNHFQFRITFRDTPLENGSCPNHSFEFNVDPFNIF